MKQKTRTLRVIRMTFLWVLLISAFTVRAQVTIGSGVSPMKGALLDLKEKPTTDGSDNSQKGIIMPRVELKDQFKLQMGDLEISDSDDGGDQYIKHTGLSVYNTSNDYPFCPGLYLWDGGQWIRLQKPCENCITPPDPVITSSTPTCDINTVLTASSAGALSFEWYKDGVLLPGQNGDTYTASQIGIYTAKAFSGTCQSGLSTGFPLSEILKTAVLEWVSSPVPTPALNVDYTFKVEDTSGSTAPIAYTWIVDNGFVVSGGGTSTVVIRFTAIGSGVVKVRAVNTCGLSNELTRPAVVTSACTNPTTPVIASSSGNTLCSGSAVLTASSSGASSFQWYKDGNLLNGQTGMTYTASTTGNYTVMAFNGTCQSGLSAAFSISSNNVAPLTGWDGTQTTNPSPNTNYTYKARVLNSATGTYTWTVTNGSIVSGQGTTSAVIKFNSAGSGNVRFVMTNSCGTSVLDQPVTIVAAIATCSAKISATVWKDFMCHNLGADTSADPLTPSQAIAGDYYQWGMKTLAANAYTHRDAIPGWNTSPAPNGAWSPASKTGNDPCPPGFRLPTRAEWDGAMKNNIITNYGSTWGHNPDNFNNGIRLGEHLFLPAPGNRKPSAGTLEYRDYAGYYWTSEYGGNNTASYLQFGKSGTYAMTSNTRLAGFSVRCIKE